MGIVVTVFPVHIFYPTTALKHPRKWFAQDVKYAYIFSIMQVGKVAETCIALSLGVLLLKQIQIHRL